MASERANRQLKILTTNVHLLCARVVGTKELSNKRTVPGKAATQAISVPPPERTVAGVAGSELLIGCW